MPKEIESSKEILFPVRISLGSIFKIHFYYTCFNLLIKFFYFSVANTAKRAFLIWLSILLFNNPVTGLSALGTFLVIAGVLLYNKAQEYDRVKSMRRRYTSKINLQ